MLFCLSISQDPRNSYFPLARIICLFSHCNRKTPLCKQKEDAQSPREHRSPLQVASLSLLWRFRLEPELKPWKPLERSLPFTELPLRIKQES